jgi:hypothetical protein
MIAARYLLGCETRTPEEGPNFRFDLPAILGVVWTCDMPAEKHFTRLISVSFKDQKRNDFISDD